MAVIETWYRQDLKQPVSVHYLDGNVFSQDNGGNLVGVEVFDDGEPASLSGTVSGLAIRADGATVAISGGTRSGNKCSITLPQSAYIVPGVVSIVMKLTSGTTITTICAVVENVYRTTTDTTIDPGTFIPSVNALIAQIDAAIGSIPADYSGLLATIAADYSTSKVYPTVGTYAWYNGVLRRSIVQITTAETYNSAHWTNAVIGNDISALKSAFNYYNSVLYGGYYCENFVTPGTYQNGSKVLESVSFKSGTTYLFTVSDNYEGQNPGYIYLKNGATTNKSFRLEVGETAHFAEWTPTTDYTDDVFVGWDASNVAGTLTIFEKPFFADCLINENESWGD